MKYNVWIHFERVKGKGKNKQHESADDEFLPIKIGVAENKAEADMVYGRLDGESFQRYFGYDPPITSAFGFDSGDVIEQAEKNGYKLTEVDAQEVLGRLLSKGDLSVGISWDTLDYFIEEYCEKHNIQKQK